MEKFVVDQTQSYNNIKNYVIIKAYGIVHNFTKNNFRGLNYYIIFLYCWDFDFVQLQIHFGQNNPF